MEQRVSMVTLGVADLARPRAFHEALGWTPADAPPEIAFLRTGATIGREPAATFRGGHSGVFIDPDGHPWEVAHDPFREPGEDGAVRLPGA